MCMVERMIGQYYFIGNMQFYKSYHRDRDVWDLCSCRIHPQIRLFSVIINKEQGVCIYCTYCSFIAYTKTLALNSNEELLTCIMVPFAGVGDSKVGVVEQVPIALKVITNCKGTLLNAEIEDESVKSSICIAIA